MKNGYNPKIVSAFYKSVGIPEPEFEYQFHPSRKWRFDLAWPHFKVALEAQGGIFSGGGHTRGAALLKEYEKLNEAARLGWRVIFVQPREVCMTDTGRLILDCLQQS